MVCDVFDAATGKALSARDLFAGELDSSGSAQSATSSNSPGEPKCTCVIGRVIYLLDVVCIFAPGNILAVTKARPSFIFLAHWISICLCSLAFGDGSLAQKTMATMHSS